MHPDQAGAVQKALACRCPRCGVGKLFRGPITLRTTCAHCGLDYSRLDIGDGFVVPILMLLGFAVVGGAIWVDFTFTPPLWVHAVLWPPVTLLLVLILTRYLKSFLAVQQYRLRRTELEQ